MLTRFTNIINELVSLGKHIPIDEQVRKVLRSLPQDERWRAKVTALQETKDFTKFNIEQLARSLMTHELHLGTSNSEGLKARNLALKAEEPDESEVDEDEAALMVRRFRKMFNRNKKFTKGNFKKGSSSKTDSGCHKCGSPDHFIRECPQWDTERGKGKAKEQGKGTRAPFNKTDIRKAMIAAWGDSESDEELEQSEEETANLCLMANSDEETRQNEVILDPK